MANKKKVIVTGFEPFGEHAVNSSWVAVQALERLGLGEAVELHVCEVPVEYQAVQSLLPSLWRERQPQLVVHVGVSGLATTVTLEQCGHNRGYKRLDNCSFCPSSQCCMEDGPDCISSVLDMETVCKRVNNSDIGVAVSVSKDAGRYLCDYTYYTSLYLGQGHSAFVHVPPLGKPYSSQDLGRALQAIVQEMLNLLELDHTEEETHKHNHHCNHKHQHQHEHQ
ncbi:pyroglutamyl-peptidase 1-like [Hippoglossus hippoglossus]|uniref:pyroglutamyl-peptidase 1-like n=1 Tax=Hippoglossus hippoglossus TaxID=8267 RepID=UPI00148DCF31|nr:pyroglutamyl-peptidase 1-like [Hippoglossus hippoglossus]